MTVSCAQPMSASRIHFADQQPGHPDIGREQPIQSSGFGFFQQHAAGAADRREQQEHDANPRRQ
jgi:hypothetical protein